MRIGNFTRAAAAAALSASAAFGWEYDQVDKVDVAPLGVSVSLWKGAPATNCINVLKLFLDNT